MGMLKGVNLTSQPTAEEAERLEDRLVWVVKGEPVLYRGHPL